MSTLKTDSLSPVRYGDYVDAMDDEEFTCKETLWFFCYLGSNFNFYWVFCSCKDDKGCCKGPCGKCLYYFGPFAYFFFMPFLVLINALACQE